MAGRIVVGTSSWTDPGFVEDWYPKGLPARDRLVYYAERLDAVEVNSTAYALPARKTVDRWAEVTPEDFTFDVKVHRLLSRHRVEPTSLPRPLRDRVEVDARGRVVLTPWLQDAMLDETLAAVEPLTEADKLATFLVQLTPAFNPGAHDLEELVPIVERLA